MRYATITDARVAFENSGVLEFVENEQQAGEVVERMFNHDESPEAAVSGVLNLDASDRRALGFE